jgi:acyl-CoA synthetase (AMP-forming)/AMP-acid ligase II
MKKIALWTALGLGLLLVGCIVPSVYPFYTDKDLTFDSNLLGTWVDVDSKPDDAKTWVFEPRATLEYKFKMTDKDSTNEFSAHLFKLKDNLFLDCQLKQSNSDAISPHYLMRVMQIQPTLKLTTLVPDWLRDYLAKNPTALRHTLAADDPSDTNTIHVVLTADTKDLQKFVLKNLDNTNAFDSVGEKKKL